MFSIAVEPTAATYNSYKRTRVVSTVRGMIYDRSLIPLVNNTHNETMVILPTEDSLNILKRMDADTDTISKLSNGYLVIKGKNTGTSVPNTPNIKTLKTFRRYYGTGLTHVTGYLNGEGKGVCGIEKYYDDFLTETGGTLSIGYNADAQGRILLAENVEIRNDGYYDKDGIVLTIDSRIQSLCEGAMEAHNISKGAVVVLDCENAQILASASTPCYSRANPEKSIDSSDSPFINRVITAFPVGSVFKVLTSAAALESGINPSLFNCTGSIEKSGNTFYCNENDGHGKIDFIEALSSSCNPYFIELGTMVGAEKLLETADKTGFGHSIEIADGYFSDKGCLPSVNDLNSSAAVGNFAFGQGNLTATPLQIANLFCTIANNGEMKKPSLIYGFTNKNGDFCPEYGSTGEKVLHKSTCKAIKNALRQTVTDGTGKLAFSSLYDCCSKTATAQSGQYDENGKEILYCWFCGFFPADNPRYVICVMKENGVSGGTDCAPVFKEIAEGIVAIW